MLPLMPLWIIIIILIVVLLGWKIIKFALKFLITIFLLLFIAAFAYILFKFIL